MCCLAFLLVACNQPLSTSAPGGAITVSSGGSPGTGGARTSGGTGGAPAATSACSTACFSGQTCSAGACVVCDGFVMPNPASAGLPNRASYVAAAGMVTDAVTGLTWEQTPTPSTYDQPSAEEYCASNRTGGLSTWRLPTALELVSLLDFTVPFPAAAIDAEVFPATPAEKFWTSTPYLGPRAGPPANAYVIDFGYGRTDSSPVTGDDVAIRVRCVTAFPQCYSPPRFTVTGTASEGTVTDAATKLVWQRGFGTAMTWAAAQLICTKAALRLPSVKELQTIVDYDVPVPETTIDTTLFPNTPNEYFWTSSAAAGLPGRAWIVSFSAGATFTVPSDDKCWVRCVK
jgi:hypothetical protein